MRINLRTFTLLTTVLAAVGFFLAFSTLVEFRVLGYLLLGLGFYLFYLLGEEKKRLHKKHKFYQKIGRLIEEQLAA